ncbi:MAG TPA: hypothetical protein VGN26_24185 [Armatimonadota bacterium]|jgi:hypothetical protein
MARLDGIDFADEPAITVSKDSRGRLPLGAVATRSRYRVNVATTGELLLTPVVEIPERELWLWRDPVASEIREALEQSARGDTVPESSIRRYDDEG